MPKKAPTILPAPPPPNSPAAAVNLPPAGDERREELKRRADDLQQQLAETQRELEVEAIDPTKIRPQREVLSLFDQAMMIVGAVPGMHYCWCPAEREASRASPHVIMKQMEGWEVVQGDMPECKDRSIMGRDGSTIRWWADTILMRIPEEKYLELRRQAEHKQHMAERGVDEALQDIGRKHAGQGVKIHQPYEVQHTYRDEQARQIAGEKFDDMLRKGAVPGTRVQSM